MAKHPKSLQFLSILQIIVGSISLLLGIVSAVLLTDFTSYIGFGIWVGVWIIIAGILGFFGFRDPQVPNRSLVGTFMGFTITACVFAGAMIICYSIALNTLADQLNCYNLYMMKFYQYRSYYYSNEYSYCGPAYVSVSTVRAGIGIDSVLLLISILEFAVGLASSIYCCTVMCSCWNGTSRMQAGQILVNQEYLQPGMGQVSAAGGGMVLTSGGPPGTVVQPSAGQYIIQQPGQQTVVPVSQPPMLLYETSQTHSPQVAGGVTTGGQTAQTQPPKGPEDPPECSG